MTPFVAGVKRITYLVEFVALEQMHPSRVPNESERRSEKMRDDKHRGAFAGDQRHEREERERRHDGA
ncbi:hypothetical protein PRUPE_6G360200 [Prunus persica]|uniref:Uncharacterized protein n=1 Tax=Prunus persica TaxID=3760 RepID=M5W467_PRUPE|nr:hypothetical protein PRUPE_6G360200 [Prunus persica]